jgi:hypothetical protein
LLHHDLDDEHTKRAMADRQAQRLHELLQRQQTFGVRSPLFVGNSASHMV